MVKHLFFSSVFFSNLYLSLEISWTENARTINLNFLESSAKMQSIFFKDKINLPQGAGNRQHLSWRPLCPFPDPSGLRGVRVAVRQAAVFLPNSSSLPVCDSCVVALTGLLHIPRKTLESPQSLPRKTLWVYKEDREKPVKTWRRAKRATNTE